MGPWFKNDVTLRERFGALEESNLLRHSLKSTQNHSTIPMWNESATSYAHKTSDQNCAVGKPHSIDINEFLFRRGFLKLWRFKESKTAFYSINFQCNSSGLHSVRYGQFSGKPYFTQEQWIKGSILMLLVAQFHSFMNSFVCCISVIQLQIHTSCCVECGQNSFEGPLQ